MFDPIFAMKPPVGKPCEACLGALSGRNRRNIVAQAKDKILSSAVETRFNWSGWLVFRPISGEMKPR